MHPRFDELAPHDQEDVVRHGYGIYEITLHMPDVGMHEYRVVAAKSTADAVKYGKIIARVNNFKVAKVSAKKLNSRFSHGIALPKGKRRLNIDEATAALAQMGYRLGNVRYDPAAGGSVYKVTQPNGSVVDMPASKLTDFIYQKAQHMRNGTKSVNQRLSRMVVGELNHALEMAVGDGEQEIARELRAVIANPTIETLKAHPLAVKEIRFKLGIAQDERMGSRVKAYTELLKSVSNRHGGKARMSQISQMLDTLESQANDQPDLAKKNIQKMVDHVAHEGTRDEFMRLVKIAERLGLRGLMSRTGAKAKFSTVPIPIQHSISAMRAFLVALEHASIKRDEAEILKMFRNIVRGAEWLERYGTEHIKGLKEDGRWSRTGAKAKFDRLAEIRARYTALKQMPKSELFALWQRKMQRGRVEVGGKMSEMDKDWLASDIINAEYNRREVEAAFAASRTGAKSKSLRLGTKGDRLIKARVMIGRVKTYLDQGNLQGAINTTEELEYQLQSLPRDLDSAIRNENVGEHEQKQAAEIVNAIPTKTSLVKNAARLLRSNDPNAAVTLLGELSTWLRSAQSRLEALPHKYNHQLPRSMAKSRFEKSDDYARILMQPVTAANCGKMQKVAADAMRHAKSVGDDDLFELAEEIANTCRTKNPNRGAK